MSYKLVKTTAQEAHEIAGHPRHLGLGGALGVSVASGVATYQVNRKLARVQGDVVPPLSATSGSSPGISGDAVTGAAKKVHKRAKGGK